MISLRRRLTLSLLAGSVVALAVAWGIVHVTVTDALASEFDVALAAKAGALGSQLESDGGYVEFAYSAVAQPEFTGGPDPEYFALWFEDGTEAMRSASLGETRLPRRFGTVNEPEYWDLQLPDGRSGRAVGVVVPVHAKDVEPPPALEDLPRVTIVVARSRARLDAALAALATGLAVAAIAALALVWWGVTWSVRTGLAPVRRLSQEVGQIDAASLSRRIDVSAVPEELTPFALKLNELFERLEGSFAKQRRMTAAMAHELRTPIAELRTASDVARRWPEDDALVDDLVATAGDVAVRMSNAVDAVMRYCRLEAGQAEPELETVRLRALLDELWKPCESHAQRRGLQFRNDVPEDLAVDSDRGLLALVFGNLLNNAASFASDGEVLAWTTADAGALTIHVGNETDQLDPADLAHVSEPFWRKDSSRTDARHSGLGLALVVAVAEVLGCTAGFALQERQFVVSIGIPAAGRDAGATGEAGRRRVPRPARVTQP